MVSCVSQIIHRFKFMIILEIVLDCIYLEARDKIYIYLSFIEFGLVIERFLSYCTYKKRKYLSLIDN